MGTGKRCRVEPARSGHRYRRSSHPRCGWARRCCRSIDASFSPPAALVFGVSPLSAHAAVRFGGIGGRIFRGKPLLDARSPGLCCFPCSPAGGPRWIAWARWIQLANTVLVSIQRPMELDLVRPVATQRLAERSHYHRVPWYDRVDGGQEGILTSGPVLSEG